MTAPAPSGVESDPRPPGTTITPTPLGASNEVNDLLVGSGLGALADSDLRAYPGRNPNWAGRTDLGHPVFVKQLVPEALQRTATFWSNAPGDVRRSTPEHLAWDDRTGVVVSEHLPDAHPCSLLAKDGSMPPHASAQAGSVLARLHRWRGDLGDLPPSGPIMPPLSWVQALPLAVYMESSIAELEAWTLLRQDGPLFEALTRLRRSEEQARQVPCHGDIRLDQFLLSGDEVHLIDWEEFRTADAARDIGAFVGDWLYLSILNTTPPADEEEGTRAFTAQLSRSFEETRPHIGAFWNAYRSERADDPGLASRATGWAGWHLFDRLIAAAKEQPRLSALTRAAAGVGRRALLRPEAASELLFPAGRDPR